MALIVHGGEHGSPGNQIMIDSPIETAALRLRNSLLTHLGQEPKHLVGDFADLGRFLDDGGFRRDLGPVEAMDLFHASDEAALRQYRFAVDHMVDASFSGLVYDKGHCTPESVAMYRKFIPMVKRAWEYVARSHLDVVVSSMSHMDGINPSVEQVQSIEDLPPKRDLLVLHMPTTQYVLLFGDRDVTKEGVHARTGASFYSTDWTLRHLDADSQMRWKSMTIPQGTSLLVPSSYFSAERVYSIVQAE
jgi:hypothetical protein